MFSVVSATTQPQHLARLREWLLAEWQKLDPFEGPNAGFIVPAPLIAINGQDLLGGLAFTSHPVPGSSSPGLWINAVIVAPEHRGNGIGSQLIKAAESEAKKIDAKELFVYSNVQALYQKLGWVELDSSGVNSVLKKIVARG